MKAIITFRDILRVSTLSGMGHSGHDRHGRAWWAIGPRTSVVILAFVLSLLAVPGAAARESSLPAAESGLRPGRAAGGVLAAAAVTLAPTGGPAGTIIAATGTGFTPGAHIHFTMDANSTIIGMVTSDSGGNFLATFPIPLGVIPGTRMITAETASASLEVRSDRQVIGSLPAGAPLLTLNPTVWKAGSPISASGTGFGASQGLDLFWDNPHGALATTPPTPTTDAVGTFANLSFTAPTSPNGFHIATVMGKTNGRSAAALLTQEVALTLSPSTASVLQNGTVDIAITANSKSQVVAAVEAFLTFDPNVLEVVDAVADTADPSTLGVQVTIGNCGVSATTPPLPTVLAHKVDNAIGTIHLGLGVSTIVAYAPVSVNCTAATVRFRGKARGASQVVFVLPPALTETKVVIDEVFLPLAVTNASVGVSGGEAAIAKVSGDIQSGQVATALANPFVATVTNALGVAVEGVPVTWAITAFPTGATGQALSATTTTTNASGQTSSGLTLGTKKGSHTVVATCASCTTTTTATFTATGAPGPATQLVKVSGDNQGGLLGTALAQPFVVEARDLYNNPVSGLVVAFAIASFPAGATGQALSVTAATTGASGQGQTTLTLGNTAGTYTVGASSGTLATVTFTATASGAEVFMNPRPAGLVPTPGAIKVVASGIVRVAPGSKVTLALQATAPPQGMSGWDVKVGYDASVVSLLPLVPVPPDPAGCISTTSTCGGDPTANPYTVSGSSLSGLTGTVLLADLTFKVIGARGSSSPLTVTVANLIDPNTDPVSAVSRSGQLIVGCASYDANCDGTVNSTDSLCVLRQAAGGYPYTTSCPTYGDYDTNRISPVNSTDSLCVLRRAAGGYPPTASCPALSLSLQPSSGPSGTPVTAAAQQFNFSAGTTVDLRLDSATGTLLTTTTVAADKTISASFTIPAGTSVGVHSIKAVVTGSIRDAADFTVTSAFTAAAFGATRQGAEAAIHPAPLGPLVQVPIPWASERLRSHREGAPRRLFQQWPGLWA